MANTIHCTICWAKFPIANLRFIAEHPSLICDPIAGSDVNNDMLMELIEVLNTLMIE